MRYLFHLFIHFKERWSVTELGMGTRLKGVSGHLLPTVQMNFQTRYWHIKCGESIFSNFLCKMKMAHQDRGEYLHGWLISTALHKPMHENLISRKFITAENVHILYYTASWRWNTNEQNIFQLHLPNKQGVTNFLLRLPYKLLIDFTDYRYDLILLGIVLEMNLNKRKFRLE